MTTDGKLMPQLGSSSATAAFSPFAEALNDAETERLYEDGIGPGSPAASAKVIEGLFRTQAPQLLRFVVRRIGRPEDAADILQEAFLRLTRLFALGPLPDRPEAYLQQIVSNLLRDGSRRRITRSEALHGPLEAQPIVDPGPGPLDHMEAREMLVAYEACLLKLKPKTRLIFLLHRRDGLTYAQIAVKAGLSVSGVEKQMMKAIAHIDREIGRPW